MPNADSSDYTRLLKLRAKQNDFSAVDSRKFRGPHSVGIARIPATYSLTNYLPQITGGPHSLAATQRFSADRMKLKRPY
jgi:hypothetical protein